MFITITIGAADMQTAPGSQLAAEVTGQALTLEQFAHWAEGCAKSMRAYALSRETDRDYPAMHAYRADAKAFALLADSIGHVLGENDGA